MLDQIKIASPCSADWERMEGTDRVRFCGECKKNVFNLSAMTRRDAEALLGEHNGNLCIKLYRRADGTVLNEDCPVGFSVKVTHVRRKIGWLVAGALSFASAFGQNSASLSGRVMDASGASIARAQVTVTDSKTKKSLELKTDETGGYTVNSLAPGTYTVKITSPGFRAFAHPDTEVTSSHETRLDVALEIATSDMGGPIAAAIPRP